MKLFEQISIHTKKVKNRIMMPPLDIFGIDTRDGRVGDFRYDHYERRSRDGIGTIVVEAAAINKDYAIIKEQIGIWDENCLKDLEKLSSVIKKHGSLAIIQLQHAGGKPHHEINKTPFGPSDMEYVGHNMRAASKAELASVPEEFARAASLAERAGFDGVEIHNAHGYLLTQMLSPLINKRTDEYGGTPEKRMKLPLDVHNAIKSAVGKDFIVGVRFGANEPEYSDGIYIAQKYEENGIHYLSSSHGYLFPEREAFGVPADFPGNAVVWGGKLIHDNVKSVPVVLVNHITSFSEAEWLLQNNCGDLIAFGKPLLATPNMIERYKNGLNENNCIYCKSCSWGENPVNCPSYKKSNLK